VTNGRHTLFFFFFFLGYRGIVHPPSADEGTERTWFEPNNVSLSDQSMASNSREGQAKCPGAKTTSHDGRAGHVMTQMCHPSKARRMASVTIQVSMQGICTPATGIALWPVN